MPTLTCEVWTAEFAEELPVKRTGRRSPAVHCGMHKRAQCGTKDTVGHPLQPTASPAILILSCCWIQMVLGRESEVDVLYTLPHFNQSHHASHHSSFIPFNSIVLWRWTRGEASGVGTLDASH